MIVRAALVILMGIVGSIGISGTASAERASRPWRSVSAPSDVLSLSDYALQPPGDFPGGEEEDEEGDTIRQPIEPPVKEGTQPSTQQSTDPFSRPDTSRQRADSALLFPGGAPAETIGPSSGVLPVPSATPTRTAVKTRRGVLGVPPLALVVGLVALHIFVVSTAGK